MTVRQNLRLSANLHRLKTPVRKINGYILQKRNVCVETKTVVLKLTHKNTKEMSHIDMGLSAPRVQLNTHLRHGFMATLVWQIIYKNSSYNSCHAFDFFRQLDVASLACESHGN